MSYEYLKEQSARFANMLTAHGVAPGDRVACLLPQVPELLVTMLGTLRAGAVYQPLFTAFCPKAIEQRLTGSEAKLIVTDAANRPKLDDIQNGLNVVSISDPRETDLDFQATLEEQSTEFAPVLLRGDDMFLMLFTSGTSSLIELSAVMESAVVGKPDAERGHIVKAFVVLGKSSEPADEQSEDLRLHVRNRLGAHAYPREIAFVDALPKTPSGKVQRFLLRES